MACRSLMKSYRSNRSRSHPGARAHGCGSAQSYSQSAARAQAGAGGERAPRSVCRRAPPPPWATSTPPHTTSTSPARTCAGKPQVIPTPATCSPVPPPPAPHTSTTRPSPLPVFLFLKRLRAAIPKAWHNKTNRKTVRVHVTIITRLILKGVLCQMAYTGSTVVTEQRLTPD